ncbi:MAG: FAD:protein FMN transferase [Cloacibacillus sp.]
MTVKKTTCFAIAAAAFFCAAFFIYGRTQAAAQQSCAASENYRMGTYVRVTLYGADKEKLDSALKETDGLLVELEELFSANIASSDVGRINTARGEWTSVDEKTYSLISRAGDTAKATGGAFNPAIGDVVKLWKIGTPQARIPEAYEIARALRNTDYGKITLKNDNGKFFVKAPEGMALDLGAIAKGRAADLLKARLLELNVQSAIIDIGGNIDLIGKAPKRGLWKIGLQHPDHPRGEYFGVIMTPAASVVTSGPYERYFEKDGKRYHHIFDPATGHPAISDFSSVTIIDADSTKADALCTALFVMGRKKADAFLKKNPEIAAVFLLSGKNEALVTPHAETLFQLTDKNYKKSIIGGAKQ